MAGHDPVRAQYEAWVYPPPIEDLVGYQIKGLGDPTTMGLSYWPDRPPRDDLKVLVAGCGPDVAPRIAFQNRRYRVVGIDISEASLSHAARLKEKHKLDNLTLMRLPLERAPKLEQSFDFVHCTGVLHHLKDPLAGLKALAKVLNPDGVILLLLYAKYARTGVHMMQELFRLLGLKQSAEDVALARQAVTQTGQQHLVRLFQRGADLYQDTGVVDLLLHALDRTYTVGECLDLVAAAGLQFQGWEQNHSYYPEMLIAADSELYKRINRLPERGIWTAMELLHGAILNHAFYVCRRDRKPRSYAVSFDDETFMERVPVPVEGLTARIEKAGITLEHARIGKIAFSGHQAAIVKAIDGKRSVRECAQAGGVPASDVVKFCRDAVRVLWRLGMHHLVHPAAVKAR